MTKPDLTLNLPADQLVTETPADGNAVAAALPGNTLRGNTLSLLDQAHELVMSGAHAAAFRLLTPPLSALWTEARGCGQAEAMLDWCRKHPLHAATRQDPFTYRASSKPRGYAGDAVMMDYIYSGVPPEDTTPLGAGIFSATTCATMGLSVRYRRQLLRSLIDDTVVSHERPRMLSVASGHCRELAGSLVQNPCFSGEFVALDQDPLSCKEVQASYGDSGQPGLGRVTVVNEGVLDLMAPGRAQALGTFDLIYSAGLYDYLSDGLARRLTARLLQMLAPGGRLLIANFVPGGTGRGYMELFMDWTLILRTPTEMAALARSAEADLVHCFLDPHRNVVYAELAAPAAT